MSRSTQEILEAFKMRTRLRSCDCQKDIAPLIAALETADRALERYEDIIVRDIIGGHILHRATASEARAEINRILNGEVK